MTDESSLTTTQILIMVACIVALAGFFHYLGSENMHKQHMAIQAAHHGYALNSQDVAYQEFDKNAALTKLSNDSLANAMRAGRDMTAGVHSKYTMAKAAQSSGAIETAMRLGLPVPKQGAALNTPPPMAGGSDDLSARIETGLFRRRA